MEVENEAANSGSVPGTTITPVPMAKLPKSKAHSAPGQGASRLTGAPAAPRD